MSRGEHLSFYLIKNIAIVGLQVVVVIINLRFLFPQFFEKKRYVLYLLTSFVLIYLTFSCSFFLIDKLFLLLFDNYFATDSPWLFSTDFWTILSGSSLYSLALFGSSLFRMIKINTAITTGSIKEEVDSIVLKDGSKSYVVDLKDVLFVKGSKEYVVWQLENKSIIVLGTLKDISEHYMAHGLIRIHKSYIVNKSKIEAVESNSIIVNGEKLPIGRVYKKNIEYLVKDLNWL